MTLFKEILNYKCRSLFNYDEIYTCMSMLLKNKTPTELEEICEYDPKALQFIDNQTDKMCISACREDGDLLRFVKNKTYEICVIACESNGRALEYVDNQTEELCLIACSEAGWVLKYVKNQTEYICIVACSNALYVLPYVINQTDKICIAAIKYNVDTKKYIKWDQMIYYYKFTMEHGPNLETKKQSERLFTYKRSGIIDYNFSQHYNINISYSFS